MTWEIRTGHAVDLLRAMPAESVQCVVTSPPYWGLRDYKSAPLVWGSDAACDHAWAGFVRDGISGGPSAKQASNAGSRVEQQQQQQCSRCGAWRGALGLEPTPDLYVAHLVEIFSEVRRVLRSDGTCWLNIGDSYASGGGETLGARSPGIGAADPYEGLRRPSRARPFDAIKPKEQVGIPWMLAFALRADGWYVRQEIIWAKGISFCETYAGSTMPESVTDRCTKGHEQIFLLTKSPYYYCDMEAIKERGVAPEGTVAAFGSGTREGNRMDPSGKVYSGTRNPRSVWAISPKGFDGEFCTACRRYYDGVDKRLIVVTKKQIGGKHARDTSEGHLSGRFSTSSPEDSGPAERDIRTCLCGRADAWLSHFATFPDDLVIPMIRAGTSEHGCCSRCGASWTREIERVRGVAKQQPKTSALAAIGAAGHGQGGSMLGHGSTEWREKGGVAITLGWAPSCSCSADVVPCIVVDPFSGSGTVVLTAQALGRDAIGLELNQDYADLARCRVRADAPLFNVASEAV